MDLKHLYKIFFLIILLFLSACSSEPRTQGWLYLRLSSDPTTLDPAQIVDTAGGAISAKIFNGLVTFGPKAEIIPDIAESWTISPDGKTYTFHLRGGVKFSTGREVAARDFKYSFERVLSPKTKSPRTWLFDRIAGAKEFMDGGAAEVAGIRAPDDGTLVIELNAPFGPFLGLLAMPGAYAVPKDEAEKSGDGFSDHPIGTGPYVLQKWERGNRLLLAANPSYFGEKPGIGGICYTVIPEDLTAVAEFERGNLDALSIPAPEFRRYTNDPKWKGLVLSQVGMNTYYLGLNCAKPPLNNILVRKGVSAAIDRERILDTIYEGRGVLAKGPVPEAIMPGGGGVAGYDPALSRKLLAQAGYPGGFPMKIYIGADQETLDMVEVIQQYLSAVGIRGTITQLEWSAFKQAINEGQADAFWLSWQADYPDPENFLYPVFHSANFGSAGNRARFKDDAFDGLITRAQSEPDPKKRDALYRAAQERAVEAAPWVFFWHKKDYVVVQPWVKGYRLYPINNADKGLGIRLEK